MVTFKHALACALDGRLNAGLLQKLPSGFQTIGDIAVISLGQEMLEHKKDIAEAMLCIHPRLRTVCLKIDAVRGERRLPSVERLAGGGTETVHRENGCAYKLDVTRVMFSKGNVMERGRLAALVKPVETVVDMFAGIGYLSIPVAKAGAGKVHALEINPGAVHYLKENIALNRLVNMEAVECDNRNAPERLRGVADRVLMGYLPGTEEFLDAAFWLLKPSGGVIHFHNTYRDSELWGKPLSVLKEHGRSHGFLMSVTEKHIVKQYAPKIRHVVVDSEFRPATALKAERQA